MCSWLNLLIWNPWIQSANGVTQVLCRKLLISVSYQGSKCSFGLGLYADLILANTFTVAICSICSSSLIKLCLRVGHMVRAETCVALLPSCSSLTITGISILDGFLWYQTICLSCSMQSTESILTLSSGTCFSSRMFHNHISSSPHPHAQAIFANPFDCVLDNLCEAFLSAQCLALSSTELLVGTTVEGALSGPWWPRLNLALSCED